jgi:hypothetical protein
MKVSTKPEQDHTRDIRLDSSEGLILTQNALSCSVKVNDLTLHYEAYLGVTSIHRVYMKALSSIILILFSCQTAIVVADTSKKQVFYLHGAIIEKGDPKPIHPKYGLYDYPAIVSALSAYDFQLISEQRQPDTDYLLYANKLVSQINALISSGVRAGDITVIGFSKGAMIAVIASSMLESDNVNFAIMATCGDWYDSDEFLIGLRLYGNIFSIYEKSDLAGSCQSLANRLPVPSSFTEIRIDTGKEHGAFFLPIEEWIGPIISWINRK